MEATISVRPGRLPRVYRRALDCARLPYRINWPGCTLDAPTTRFRVLRVAIVSHLSSPGFGFHDGASESRSTAFAPTFHRSSLRAGCQTLLESAIYQSSSPSSSSSRSSRRFRSRDIIASCVTNRIVVAHRAINVPVSTPNRCCVLHASLLTARAPPSSSSPPPPPQSSSSPPPPSTRASTSNFEKTRQSTRTTLPPGVRSSVATRVRCVTQRLRRRLS